MKAIVLAGGTGTRLRPLTAIINKHMLPVYNYPMIHYGIEKLAEAGVHDILLVTSRTSAGMFINYLGGGQEYGVSITYLIQEEAGGIAQALDLARPYVQMDEKFILLLGDNLIASSLRPFVAEFNQQESGAMVLLKQVPDPERYGVPVFDDQGVITYIMEKPKNPVSNYSVTGIYFYDGSVFDIIASIAPSARGELEITDVNNGYAAAGKLTYRELEGWWIDAGTFDSLHEAAAFMQQQAHRAQVGGNESKDS